MITIEGRRWRHLAWGVAVALASVSAAAGKADRRHPGKVSEKVRSEAERKGTSKGSSKGASKVNVIVQFRHAPGAAEKMLVNAFSGTVRRPLKSSSRWMAVQLPADLVAKMADNPIVEFIATDAPVAAATTM